MRNHVQIISVLLFVNGYCFVTPGFGRKMTDQKLSSVYLHTLSLGRLRETSSDKDKKEDEKKRLVIDGQKIISFNIFATQWRAQKFF